MNRFSLTLGAALAAAALTAPFLAPGSASAHVHGIAPLLQCSVDNASSGGLAVDSTPAFLENGGPITGLIPRDVGDAPLTGGDGGFDAPVQCP
jgi:hypothetical protein